MNREEILEKSKRENRNRQDEREKYVDTLSGSWANTIGGIVCAMIILIETFFSEFDRPELWSIFCSMFGTAALVRYLHLRKTHDLIAAVIELLGAAVFFIFYVIKLVG